MISAHFPDTWFYQKGALQNLCFAVRPFWEAPLSWKGANQGGPGELPRRKHGYFAKQDLIGLRNDGGSIGVQQTERPPSVVGNDLQDVSRQMNGTGQTLPDGIASLFQQAEGIPRLTTGKVLRMLRDLQAN